MLPRGQLQDAIEALQDLFRVLPGTARGIGEDHAGRVVAPKAHLWCDAAPSAVVPCQGPEIPGLCPAPAWVQNRRRGLVYYPAGDCAAICREGMNSLPDPFRCSASRSTTGPRWKAAVPTQSASVLR